MIAFTVQGQPQPQGSMRTFVKGGKISTTSANANLKPWRQQVSDVAFVECGGIPYHGDGKESMRLRVVFHFMKPKSAKKRTYPTVKPDIDKLLRAIMDALTGIAYHDDAQVVEVHAQKHYGLIPMAEIEITEL